MVIETTKERLEYALGRVVRATTRQSTLPVLSCVFFDLQNGTLVVRGTNLDLGAEVSIPVKSNNKVAFAVPGALILSVVSALPPESLVSLQYSDTNLQITSGGRSSVIRTVPHEDFPVLPRVSRDVAIHIPIEGLLHGFRSVWYSASVSTVKPELGAVAVSVVGGSFVFAATDAFRLAEKRIPLSTSDANGDSFNQLLIPFKNTPEIIRILEGVSGSVEVAISGSQIGLYTDSIYVTSRVVEGTFPDYQQIIPREFATHAVLLKHDFLRALKGITVFSDKFNQVRCTIRPSKKSFEIATRNTDVGESHEEIQATLSGDDLDIVFNHRYIMDCFQSIPDESIQLRFGGQGKPLLIQGSSDDSFLYLVMPMNK